jgi:hypothetical protein
MTQTPGPNPAPVDDEKPHGDKLDPARPNADEAGAGGGGQGATVQPGSESTFEPEEDAEAIE